MTTRSNIAPSMHPRIIPKTAEDTPWLEGEPEGLDGVDDVAAVEDEKGPVDVRGEIVGIEVALCWDAGAENVSELEGSEEGIADVG